MMNLKKNTKHCNWKPAIWVACALAIFNTSIATAEEFECFFEPHMVVRVGSPVSGILRTVNVERGDEVKKGQVIAQIRSGIEQASADLAKARAEFDSRRVERNEILYREKMGFGVPIDHWLRHDLKTMAFDLLLSGTSMNRGYFNPVYVETLLQEHCSGKRDWHYHIWNLLMLEMWHRAFIDGDSSPNHA